MKYAIWIFSTRVIVFEFFSFCYDTSEEIFDIVAYIF